jgi:hypothetical protein
VLLATWSQVATANAVPCAIWCEIQGSMAMPGAESGHHHGDAPAKHDCSRSVSSGHCGTPQLLVVSVVGPELLDVPAQVVTAGDDPVAPLHSFLSSPPGFDTPPPRV